MVAPDDALAPAPTGATDAEDAEEMEVLPEVDGASVPLALPAEPLRSCENFVASGSLLCDILRAFLFFLSWSAATGSKALFPPTRHQEGHQAAVQCAVWEGGKKRNAREVARMRFKFCGDLDAPEWLLREVASLSRMTYVRTKLLAMHVLGSMLGTAELDLEKVRKLVSTAGFDASDVRGAIAAVRFVFCGAAQYDVVADALEAELCQIGLPAEHSRAFSRAYATHRDRLRARLAAATLSLPRVAEVHWRVDYVLSCAGIRGVNAPAAQIKLRLTNGDEAAFSLTADKLRVLLADLKEARAIVEAK
jgi:hypothetical protein